MDRRPTLGKQYRESKQNKRTEHLTRFREKRNVNALIGKPERKRPVGHKVQMIL